MKLYTSYWAQVRNFPPNLVGLNTTIWPPKWRPLGKDNREVWVIDCPPLKPGPSCEGLCRGDCNPKHPENCQFLINYYNQLRNIDIRDFFERLVKLKNKMENEEKIKDISFAFIVFETPSNKCSERVMIHLWLKDWGVEVEEWIKPDNIGKKSMRSF